MEKSETVILKSDSVAQCGLCGNTEPSSSMRCSRCGASMKPLIIQPAVTTLALLATAVILYIPANLLPVMVTYQFGKASESTILGGVSSLWHHGDYVIASVIFIASVVIPLAKIIALSYLVLTTVFTDNQCPVAKTRLFQLTEILGKWSMIDVFVVVILVTLVQLGNIMSIKSGPGILSFAAVVVFTMIAASTFDTRLLWESHSSQKQKNGC